MSDAFFNTQSVAGGDAKVDNELVTTSAGVGLIRQRVRLGGSTGTLLAEVGGEGSLQVAHRQEIKDGSITTSSGLPNPGGGGTSASVAAAAQVYMSPQFGHSSWSLQITGTWTGALIAEATNNIVVAIPGSPTLAEINAATWVPIQARQSNGGRLSNTYTQNGLDRGVFGGLRAFRVRSTDATWTGTANISLTLGASAAVFQNSDVVVQTEEQYYASSAGLNTMWGVSTPEVALVNGTADQPLAIITNTDPAGGRVLYIWRLSFGTSATAKLKRWRSPTLSRTSGGTQMSPVNRGLGGSVDLLGRTTAASFYGGTGIVVANQPAAFSKIIYNSGADNDTSTENGSILIPPGQSIYFTVAQVSNGTMCALEIVYWDGSSLT